MSLRRIIEQGIARSQAFSEQIEFKQQVYQNTEILNRLMLEVDTLRSENDSLSTRIAHMEQRLTEEQAKCSPFHQSCEDLTRSIQALTDPKADYERLASDLQASHGSVKELKNQLAATELERDALLAEQLQLTAEKSELDRRLGELERETRPLRALLDQVDTLRGKVARVQDGARQHVFQQRIEALQQEIENCMPDPW